MEKLNSETSFHITLWLDSISSKRAMRSAVKPSIFSLPKSVI